jgi:predicted ATPase
MSYGLGHIQIFFNTGGNITYKQNVYNDNMLGKNEAKALDASQNYSGSIYASQTIFIPEKEMLSHSNGMLAMKHERLFVPFDDTQTDIIIKAQLYPKKDMPDNQICDKITRIIGGEVVYDNDTFYIRNEKSGSFIPFSLEASGYRKFGLLWKLIRNGLLESGSILFWDEPENSLNPELVPVLVDILLALTRNGVQIILATHSEILAGYFAVLRDKVEEVMFYTLYKDGEQIKSESDTRFDLLEPNTLADEPVKMYKMELEKGLGGNG